MTSAAAGKIRVLLADDHELVRAGLRRLLDEQADIRVVAEAASGRAALRLSEEKRLDVVVMDIGMPDLNGIEATRRIAAGRGGPKVLCLSMHTSRKLIRAMLEAGAAGYLVKGAAPRELVEGVRAVHAGKTYISPLVAKAVVEELIRSAPAPARGPFQQLTDREREVLQLIAEGLNSKDVASRLGVSQNTALAHRKRILEKLNLHTDVDLARYALREGLTEL
jgi:DNA-binding NarL/FixJ family response regulator